MRSGRRWIDLADPAEEAALSTDYAALLRAFPCADRDVGSGGIVPLDRLIAAVRSVSATWAKHQQAAARFEIAAASDAPRARSARRGRPVRQRAASLNPFALLPPPPILPSLPLCRPCDLPSRADLQGPNAGGTNGGDSEPSGGRRAGPRSEPGIFEPEIDSDPCASEGGACGGAAGCESGDDWDHPAGCGPEEGDAAGLADEGGGWPGRPGPGWDISD